MPENSAKIFFIADIVGEAGLSFLETMLPPLIEKHEPDFIIANGENSHEGRGINRDIVRNLYGLGVNVITGGNHSFDKWKIFSYMKSDPNLLRPLNYPKGNAGYGYGIYDLPGTDKKIGVLNLQGRTYMQPIDDPFSTSDWALEKIKEETDIIFVDFHAEATAEKISMAWQLDGRVSVLVGTHTHIPTNDARIFPQGMGYVTDAGMTGPFNSVIGMKKKTSINRFLLGTPQRFHVAKKDNHLCGVLAMFDLKTLNCKQISSSIYPDFQSKVE